MAAPAVDAGKIVAELRWLWRELGKAQDQNGGVLRACSMTLLIAADSTAGDIAPADGTNDDAAKVHEIVGELMHDHPSRAIVLAPLSGVEISARVFSECWRPYHGRQQICAEGIEIRYDAEQSHEVARLLVPLLAPDLPTVLWCRGTRAFLDRSLDPLFPLARKIIFDTNGVRYPPAAIEFLRRLREQGLQVADLSWTRLTNWRRAVASVFETPPKAGEFTLAHVQHGGDRATTGVYYMARWIERCMSGLSVIVEEEPGPSGLLSVTFSGAQRTVSLQAHAASGALDVDTGTRQYQILIPKTTEEDLMREELTILDRDPVFERVLE